MCDITPTAKLSRYLDELVHVNDNDYDDNDETRREIIGDIFDLVKANPDLVGGHAIEDEFDKLTSGGINVLAGNLADALFTVVAEGTYNVESDDLVLTGNVNLVGVRSLVVDDPEDDTADHVTAVRDITHGYEDAWLESAYEDRTSGYDFDDWDSDY
jgi:hypothetical protein